MKQLTVDIWNSLRALPLWVQLWIWLVLVPVNFASIFFVYQPLGFYITVLAIGGIMPNAVLLLLERGFSKAMAFSHIVLWPPLLVLILAIYQSPLETAYLGYLTLLFAVNAFSLVFDLHDAWRWIKGDRKVPRR